jgi:serine/threonine-protein kinase PknK
MSSEHSLLHPMTAMRSPVVAAALSASRRAHRGTSRSGSRTAEDWGAEPAVSTSHDGGLIPRERLIDLLRAGRCKRLALIHAPAGFGKTTLAEQWHRALRTDGVPVAWISLSRNDNDAVQFLDHVIDAIRRVQPDLGANLGDSFKQQCGNALRYVSAQLVGEIADHRGPLAIVLDDWHLIEDPDTTAALELLLDSAPDNLHVIVTSRTRAPAIGKLKVCQQVTEIDATQLAFNREESAAFLIELNTLDLNDDDVHRLWSSTEGWIAALQLAKLSLRNTEDPSALVGSFCGRHHSVADYLAENVLSTLPNHLLEFLVTTSICRRLCGGLAGAVSGQPAGQAILEELERREMFVRPLDDNREWFRYHHLFAEYLRQRLERDHPDRIVSLHRRASAWFAEHGLLNEAVTHALAAGDDTEAVELVEQQAMRMVEHGRMTSLLDVVGLLPKSLLINRPTLQIAVAWAHCLLHQTHCARITLDHIRAARLESPDEFGEDIIAETNLIQAYIDVCSDRIDRAEGLVAPYLAPNSTHRPWLVAVSANVQTFVDIQTFAYDTAQSRQRCATASHDSVSAPFTGVYGRCLAGLAAFAQLDLVSAQRLYTEALALTNGVTSDRSHAARSHAARLAGALLAKLKYERTELAAAETLLDDPRGLATERGGADFLIATHCTQARIKILHGEAENALALLREGAAAGQRLSLPRAAAAMDHELVRLHLALGDIGRAQDILTRRSNEIADGPDGITMAIRHYQLSMRAKILIAHNEHDAARDVLALMLDESRAAGWRYAEISTTVEMARAFAVAGDSHAAAEVLVPALVIGARSGLVRTIVDSGPELLRIIGDLREANRSRRWPSHLPEVPAAYLSSLLATAHLDAQTATIQVIDRGAGRNAIPEAPLNAREVDILRLLDLGLSNKQIARSLSVSINTVKWYLKNIYTKLGVTGRGGSVREARRRSILT